MRVKLDHDGAILDVDEDDVEKVNRRLLEGWEGSGEGGPVLCGGDRICFFIAHPLVLLPRLMLLPATD